MSQPDDVVAHEAGHGDAGGAVAVSDDAEMGDAGTGLDPADVEGDGPEAVTGAENGASPEPSVRDLELEGEIAADYIEGLLDVADLDGDIDMDVEGDRAVVSVVGATLEELVGKHGKTVLMVTHDALVAERANTTLHLDKGVLVEGRKSAQLSSVGGAA